MLVHSVYFWLKSDLTPAERAQFLAGLESLRGIKSVDSLHIGSPAAVQDRPVVDKTFSYNLLVLVKDVAAHDAYQIDPLHLAFVANCKHLWTRVQIYDAA